MTNAGTARGAWDLLEQFGTWLGPCFTDADVDIPKRLPPWSVIVEAASAQMIAPALGYALRAAPALPDEARTYFGAVLDMNRERNHRVMGALERAALAMNGAGLVPALLKGAAILADRTYPDPGVRVIVDLDLLVPEPRTQMAFDALRAAGFRQGGELTRGEHHHLPNLIDPVSAVRVEIHRMPLAQRVGELAAADACMRGREVAIGDTRVIVPPPTERMAHCIAHGQLAERRYREGVPHLRQLLDVAALRRQHDTSIDWTELERRFARTGARAALVDNLALVEALLHQPPPLALGGQRAEAAARTKRALNRNSAHERLMRTWWGCQDAFQLLRRDPMWAAQRAIRIVRSPFRIISI